MQQNFSAFSYKVSLVTDFSRNSPKLRLSALGYLLDNGFLNLDKTPEDLIAYADAFVKYVVGGNEEFVKNLEALEMSDMNVPDNLEELFKNEDNTDEGGYL